jgi:hypothetical protein
MQSLSKSDEQQLLDGVKKAVDLVDNRDMSPNEALQKVAKDMDYSPGFVKAACNAFNNGRQLAQWKANDNVLDKLASFPLANYDEIHDSIWGSQEEKAASVNSQRPLFMPKFASYEDEARQQLLDMDISTFEKSASAREPSPEEKDYEGELRIKLAFNKVEFRRRQFEDARRDKVAAEDNLNLKIHLLESYFKKFAYDRLPLAQVENAAAAYYGKPGAALVSYVADRFPSEKRAADHQPTWAGFNQPADRNAEPYTLISECIKQAQVHNAMAGFLEDAKNELAEAEKSAASFTQPRSSSSNGSPAILTPSLIEDVPGEKQANIFGGLAGGVGLGLAKNLTDAESVAREDAIEKQIGELDSPEHLNELRKIRAQTALTQMMSDPGNPLSEYDPEEVLAAYNEIVQLSPRLADQPSALGPLLSKRLMGNTEPFEVGETLKMEEALKKTQPIEAGSLPTSGGPDAIERLRGESSSKSDDKNKTSVMPLVNKMEGALRKSQGGDQKKSQTNVMKNEESIIS